jgi:phosphoglucosamine mutase
MTLKFGTDGVRGRAFIDLEPEWVTSLARAAAQVLKTETVVVGTDGRESGPAFVQALRDGFEAEGVEVWYMGRVPTPAVAHIAATRGIAGAMVSASHNPSSDNGIKFFSPGGNKLNDEDQKQIEILLESEDFKIHTQIGHNSVSIHEHLVHDWIASLQESIDGRNFEGLSVVIDCANGSVSHFAYEVLHSLGVDVKSIHDAPDGLNINHDCGSTNPSSLRSAVTEIGADLGLAFDGDADRVLAVDQHGRIIDGDYLIAICAEDMKLRQRLQGNTTVVTVMTNLGFHLAMKEKGIQVHETLVGDRHVLEALEKNKWSLGGEQSGHVIFRDLSTTGDGLLTGIQLLDVVKRSGRELADLADAAMVRYPQVLRQVNMPKVTVDTEDLLIDEILTIENELGESGRVLVRPSGTEPVLRIMVEATTHEQAKNGAQRLVSAAETFFASFQLD